MAALIQFVIALEPVSDQGQKVELTSICQVNDFVPE